MLSLVNEIQLGLWRGPNIIILYHIIVHILRTLYTRKLYVRQESGERFVKRISNPATAPVNHFFFIRVSFVLNRCMIYNQHSRVFGLWIICSRYNERNGFFLSRNDAIVTTIRLIIITITSTIFIYCGNGVGSVNYSTEDI